jgi:hypothetical protein
LALVAYTLPATKKSSPSIYVFWDMGDNSLSENHCCRQIEMSASKANRLSGFDGGRVDKIGGLIMFLAMSVCKQGDRYKTIRNKKCDVGAKLSSKGDTHERSGELL